MKEKSVGILGAGSFGTAIANVLARDVQRKKKFSSKIKVWIFDEPVENKGEKTAIEDKGSRSGKDDTKIMLSEYIKRYEENVKYLPGVPLPDNLVFTPDLKDVASCDIVIFVIPHQFLNKTIGTIKKINKRANTIAVSLIKGMLFSEETSDIVLISEYIEKELGWKCAAAMGANIAKEMGNSVSEMTIGIKSSLDERGKCREADTTNEVGKDKESTVKEPVDIKSASTDADILRELFDTPHTKIAVVEDKTSVELFGALKNIVAIAYGIVKGLNASVNTQASVMRRGMLEMIKFVKIMDSSSIPDTVLESCGVPDLMVSCLSGRNSQCGQKMAQGLSISRIESEMGGQKLQGTLCAVEVANFLKKRGFEKEFPLFLCVYEICYGKVKCKEIFKIFE